MQNFQDHFFSSGIRHTPKSVKVLITLLVLSSILSPPLTFFLNNLFHLPGPLDFLPLSLYSIKKIFLFEWFTYPFIHSLDHVLSLSMLVSLSLHMILLWFLATEISVRFGTKRFFWLFFSSTLFTALLISCALIFTHSKALLYGTTPVLSALLAFWMSVTKEERISFLVFFKAKIKTIVLTVLALILLMNLSQGAYFHFLANLGGIFYGVFFGMIPRGRGASKEPKKSKVTADIIDITRSSEDPDDVFMDEMLDKIAKVGREGLSRKEKMRMDEIVKKRKS